MHPCVLLVGINIVIMENSISIPQNVGNDPVVPLLDIYPKYLKSVG